MLYGAVAVSAAWVALAVFVLLPNGARRLASRNAGSHYGLPTSDILVTAGLRYLRLALVVFVVSGIIAATRSSLYTTVRRRV